MPDGSCSAVTVPINRRNIEAPHSPTEKVGMEGSRVYFSTLYVGIPDQGNQKFQHGEAEKPMTAHLPTVRYSEKKKRCADCNKQTNLRWESRCRDMNGREIHDPEPHNRYWLSQGCAKRRGGIYLQAVQKFLCS
jgi:hypothetical protein